MKIIFKNSGMTAMEALIAAAIAGGLMMAVASIFSNVTRMSAKSESITSVYGVSQLASLIFMNQSLCDNALRPAGSTGTTGPHVTFNAAPAANIPNATIDHIELFNPLLPAQDGVAMKINTLINSKLMLDKIEFYEATPGVGRSQIVVGNPPSGLVYDVYAGYVQLTFRANGDASGAPTSKYLAGGAPPPMKIPLTVAVGEGTHTIDYCYAGASLKNLCRAAGGTIQTSGPQAGRCWNTIRQKFEAAVCPPPSSPPCIVAYPQIPVTAINQFVFDGSNDGWPQCNCIGVVPVP